MIFKETASLPISLRRMKRSLHLKSRGEQESIREAGKLLPRKGTRVIWNDYQDALDWGMPREGSAASRERTFDGLSIESQSKAFYPCWARTKSVGLADGVVNAGPSIPDDRAIPE
ncbi:hypothetical protein [Rhodopirellula sp. P2]|uniref:hypothetical protein n=1 Tax=Rhodopirellula sp. P2 TaxID=2127060 RepID=UPI0023683ADE|nr:hypothetical protein [Rhodopirellula sp. P2]WDQ18406.1 hypothetical protein PSR62_07625 [Rhodopirellula sp. P2]